MEMSQLVLVRAIIRREKLSDVLQGLVAASFTGATVIEASGMGGEGGVVNIRGRSYGVLIPRVIVEVAVPAEAAPKVIDIIMSKAMTGRVGDGRIFVLPLIEIIRIRTGERGIAGHEGEGIGGVPDREKPHSQGAAAQPDDAPSRHSPHGNPV